MFCSMTCYKYHPIRPEFKTTREECSVVHLKQNKREVFIKGEEEGEEHSKQQVKRGVGRRVNRRDYRRGNRRAGGEQTICKDQEFDVG